MKMHAPLYGSTHIKAMGYDEDTRTLAVEFHKGGVYHYHGIDKHTYLRMHGHESPGNFLHRNIKGLFKTTRRA